MIALASFGLKQIPFSSQGSESGKYPFVPSGSFNELILEIEKIHDGDPSAIIVRGPQGSGKSATKYGLNEHFSKKGVTIIQINLSSASQAKKNSAGLNGWMMSSCSIYTTFEQFNYGEKKLDPQPPKFTTSPRPKEGNQPKITANK